MRPRALTSGCHGNLPPVHSCTVKPRAAANRNASAHIAAKFWACLFIYAVIMNMKMFATKTAQKATEMWGCEYRYSGASRALPFFGCRSPERAPAVMRAVLNVKIEWLF